MENCGEVGVLEYMRLMTDYVTGAITADQYTRAYFAFNKRRVNMPNKDASQIVLKAHADADNYEPDSQLRGQNPTWIDENQLKDRVANSLRELEDLGYRAD